MSRDTMYLNTEDISGPPTTEAVRTEAVPPGENLRSPQVVHQRKRVDDDQGQPCQKLRMRLR